MQESTTEILTLVSKEKFRRKLVIASRIIAIFLILAIIFIGYVQIKYMSEINEYRSKYGHKWSCYLCGLEKGRRCTCTYLPDLTATHQTFDKETWLKNIAFENTQPCPDLNEDFNGNFNENWSLNKNG